MKDQIIATWSEYQIIRSIPSFGRPFYSISRNGRTISRGYGTKRGVTKMLRLIQAAQPAPLLDTKIEWLRNQTDTFGHSSI